MKTRHFLFLICLIASSSWADTILVAKLFPLNVGRSWTYQRFSSSPDLAEPKVWKNEVLSEQDGRFVVSEKNIESVYGYDKQGIFKEIGSGKMKGVEYLLRGPIRKGNQWSSKTRANADGVSRVDRQVYTITATNMRVDVPAGSFENCVELTVTEMLEGNQEMPVVSRVYFAPDVGIIKFVFTLPMVNTELGFELVQYKK